MDSFWDEIKDFNFDLKWLFKVRNHLEKFERKLQETKRQKLSNLSKNSESKKLVLARFREHLPHFEFKVDFTSFCESRCQDFDNIHTLLTLNESNNSKNESDVFFQASQNNRTEFANNIQNNAENEIRNSAENSLSSKVDNILNESENVAMFRGNRLEGKFVSKNVINLSRRNLSSVEISLLSKGLKFVATANKIDQAKLKRELEEYGRKLRLMWHFRNDERPFSQERPVICNCGFYTENISSFLDFHLQPLAQKVKPYIKDTNHFFKKIKELGQLPEGTILCTIDVVGLYPNIPHDEGLAFLEDFLDSRVDKQVTTDTLIELTELVLKNNIFEFSDKTYKQIRGTAICTKFAPPYAVLFMAVLEGKILSKVKKKPSVWWRYIDDIFFLWEHGEESLQEFINEINSFHPTIKFMADWSK